LEWEVAFQDKLSCCAAGTSMQRERQMVYDIRRRSRNMMTSNAKDFEFQD
jgi:hypothetical protein